MKKKRNFLLLILAVLLIGLGAGSTTVSAFSLPKLQNAESGQVVQRGCYYYYRYTDKTYARNQYLRINKRLCYFNKSGKRWHGFLPCPIAHARSVQSEGHNATDSTRKED